MDFVLKMPDCTQGETYSITIIIFWSSFYSAVFYFKVGSEHLAGDNCRINKAVIHFLIDLVEAYFYTRNEGLGYKSPSTSR